MSEIKLDFETTSKILSQTKYTNRQRIALMYSWIILGHISEQTFAELLSYGWRVDISG